MGTLNVYCDEGGHMPERDDEDALVAGVVAVPNAIYPTLPEKRSNANWTARLLREIDAVPVIYYIRPHPGFGEAFRKHLDIAKFMAEVDQRRGRPRHWFKSPADVCARNFGWVYTMGQAIGGALIHSAMKPLKMRLRQ